MYNFNNEKNLPAVLALITMLCTILTMFELEGFILGQAVAGIIGITVFTVCVIAHLCVIHGIDPVEVHYMTDEDPAKLFWFFKECWLLNNNYRLVRSENGECDNCHCNGRANCKPEYCEYGLYNVLPI